jgi:hypothetical protein
MANEKWQYNDSESNVANNEINEIININININGVIMAK